MKIYTKRGDGGETSLFNKGREKNLRISKADPLIEAIGSIDEANSYIGIVNSKLKAQNSKLKLKTQNLEKRLQDVQKNLFTIGSTLAGAKVSLKNLNTDKLENEIDKMEKYLPKLSGFILPGGSDVGAYLMYARTLVRRAERRIIQNSRLKSQKSKFQLKSQNTIFKYINRLSDYLFVLARLENHKRGIKEIMWKF